MHFHGLQNADQQYEKVRPIFLQAESIDEVKSRKTNNHNVQDEKSLVLF
jgi:hypothetical protein